MNILENIKLKTGFFSWRASLLFIIPFIFIFSFNSLLGINYLSTNTDTTQGFFGLGLNWLTLTPKLLMHHPGYFFHELSGLIIKLIGFPVLNLHLFEFTGVVINLFFLFFASIWVGYIHGKYGGGVWLYFVFGFLTATMPTVLLASDLWTLNFPIIILSIPACLQFYYSVESKNLRSLGFFLSLFGLGFIVGNLIIGAVFVAGAFFSTILARSYGVSNFLGGEKRSFIENFFYFTAFLFVLSLVFAVLTLIAPVSNTARQIFFIYLALSGGFGVLAVIILWRLAIHYQAFRSLLLGFFAPVFCGWFVAVNVMTPFYFTSAMRAFATKGGSELSGDTLVSRVSRLDLWGYFSHTPWHFIVLIIFIISAIYFFRSLFYRAYHDQLAVSAFCFLSLFLNYLIAWDTMAAPIGVNNWFGIHNFGQISRYFMLAPAVVSVFFVYLARINKKFSVVLIGATLLLSALTGYQFIGPFARYVTQRNLAINDFNNYFNNLLLENKKVICLRTTLPEYCSVLYAFNNYRSEQSLTRLNKYEMQNGKIVYISPLEYGNQQSFINMILTQKPNFVVAEKSEHVDFFQLIGGRVWPTIDPILNVQVWEFDYN